MNLRQKILIFRTCLAVLVVLRRLVYEQIDNQPLRKKTTENLQGLIRKVNDEVNYLYAEEEKREAQQEDE